MRQLIQDGRDVNTFRGDIFVTTTAPLVCAAVYGHVQVVGELIRVGAGVNAKDYNKRTALHKASWCGHSSVTSLIEAGANPNEQDEYGMTPLMNAAYNGHHQVVNELRRCADVSVISSRWWMLAAGSTALHFQYGCCLQVIPNTTIYSS